MSVPMKTGEEEKSGVLPNNAKRVTNRSVSYCLASNRSADHCFLQVLYPIRPLHSPAGASVYERLSLV